MRRLWHRDVATTTTLCIALVLMLAGGVPDSANAQGKDLLVFAAASLKNALDDVNTQYFKDTGRRVVVSYGASPALAKQIEAAAPADLFISADLDWMDYLSQRGLIKAETRVSLLGNRLVLIAPAGEARDVKIGRGFPLATLLGGGHLAMADPDSVPAGKYGKAALEHFGVWTSVQGKVARAENVRAALALVSRGEAPLGIVYQTDAAADVKVRIVGVFPEDSYPPITYPVAAVTTSSHEATTAYLGYLRSGAARSLFERQGFIVIEAPR
jgi:molybdate transport system substrate-binding protein